MTDENESPITIEEIDEMIRDLEETAPEQTWSIDELRRIRAEMVELSRDERYAVESLAARLKRMLELYARGFELIEEGARIPRAGESAADSRRHVQRLREKKIEPDLPDDVRERKARATEAAAKLLHEERFDLERDVEQMIRELTPIIEKHEAAVRDVELEQREVAREFAETTKLTEMNRARRTGRGRPKRK